MILEVNFMREVLGQAQIVFVHTDGGLVFEKSVNISGPIFFWSPKMASSSISFLAHVLFLTLGSCL
jgi:hypothetical protein